MSQGQYRSDAGYASGVLISGLLIADRVQTLCSKIFGETKYTEMDFYNYPNLLLKVEKVQLIDRFNAKQTTLGTLYITTTHLIFVADDSGKETWILHSHIGSAERGQITAAGSPLTISCKSFLLVSFLMARDKECQDVYDTLNEISQPINIEDVYAFSYVPSSNEFMQSDGWNAASTLDDYTRMGVPNDVWVETDFNANYAHCDTYPQRLFVPRSAPKQVFIGSSKFRSRGRLPVLAYLYPPNQASICRCSQPLTGFSARCVEDEMLMEHILRTNNRSNVLYVVDTRPKMNAMANKAAGKGFENEANYNNMKFYFLSIENIHVMRGSLQKMLEASSVRNASVASYLVGLESSGWLRHIRAILEAGVFIADSLIKGISCVVHCSDGWDRTPQTISVASIILDPYYRTMKGFQTLIQKDWLAFGHKFTDRCAQIRQQEPREISPVFTQFLECVWNMMQQYPKAFEFNERYLLILHDNVYACQFGTFLGNCEKDRADLRLAQRTYSYWGYVERQLEEFLNPTYDSGQKNVLRVDLRPQFIRFWRSMYNRFDVGVHPRESLQELATTLREHVDALEDTATALSKRVNLLKTALGKSSIKSPTSPYAMQDSGHFTTESADSLTTGSGNASSFVEHDSNHIETASQLGSLKLQSDSESGVEDFPTPIYVSDGKRQQPKTGAASYVVDSVSKLMAGGIQTNWQSVRLANECSACSNHFQHWQRKYHCWHCGNVFCRRCVDCEPSVGVFSSENIGSSVFSKPTSCRSCRQVMKSQN